MVEAAAYRQVPAEPALLRRRRVPTSILTLNRADASSQAHNLDASLSPIDGKSREGFKLNIDLQVQIHVPDTKAPKVISMVGTMQNLLGQGATAIVAVATEISAGQGKIVPDVLVTGGGSALDALAATLVGRFSGGGGDEEPAKEPTPSRRRATPPPEPVAEDKPAAKESPAPATES